MGDTEGQGSYKRKRHEDGPGPAHAASKKPGVDGLASQTKDLTLREEIRGEIRSVYLHYSQVLKPGPESNVDAQTLAFQGILDAAQGE